MAGRRGKRLGAVVVAAGLFLSACGGTAPGTQGEGTPAPAGEAVASLGQVQSPSGNFCPGILTSAYDGDVSGLIFESLLRLKPDLSYEANMADYQLADGGLTLTFVLKDGIQFSDGEPLTAEDVRDTFYLIMDPKFPGPIQSNYESLRGAVDYFKVLSDLNSRLPGDDEEANKAIQNPITPEEWDRQAYAAYEEWKNKGAIEVLSDKEIAFHFDEIYAPALAAIGGQAIFSRKALSQVTDVAQAGSSDLCRKPVGTGPFILSDFQPDQYTVLVKNPTYFRGAPKVDKVIFKVVQETQLAGHFLAGELDGVGFGSSFISPKDQPLVLQQMPDVQTWELPDFGYQYMWVNLRDPLFQDVKVRQALVGAIDRQGMVDVLFDGHGAVQNTIFAQASWANPSGLETYPYDPDKSKALLEEAGWTQEADGTWTKTLGGKKTTLKFTLTYSSGTQVIEELATLVQNDLRKIGIPVELKSLEFNSFVGAILNSPPGRKIDVQAGTLGWALSTEPDPTGLFEKDAVYNFAGWSPETVGKDIYDRSMELTKAGLRTFDQAERKAIYQELGQIYNQYLPYIFLYTQTHIVDVNPRLKNVNRDIRGPLTDAHLWEISQ
ncbi:MAG: ABC transporter substrate-binding protein [Bacillota bacterium]|nr:ABC transporter substrate-binding protein [Bacillota bacterium]